MVKASVWRVADPGLDSRLRQDFSKSSHTNDFNIDTLVTTVPGGVKGLVTDLHDDVNSSSHNSCSMCGDTCRSCCFMNNFEFSHATMFK